MRLHQGQSIIAHKTGRFIVTQSVLPSAQTLPLGNGEVLIVALSKEINICPFD